MEFVGVAAKQLVKQSNQLNTSFLIHTHTYIMHAKPLNSNKSMYILFIVGMCFILSFLNSFCPLSIQCTWSAELMYSYKIVTQSNLHFSLIDYASSVKLRRLTNDSLSLSLSLIVQAKLCNS